MADNDGLSAFIKDLRRFCQQSAGILGLVDRELSSQGWETAMAQNIAFAEVSSRLDAPKRWFPSELFRFYTKPATGAVDRVAFVSLLIDDDPEGTYTLPEPLASAGLFYLREAQDISYVVKYYWWARFHGYGKDRWTSQSKYCSLRPQEIWSADVARQPEWYPFHLVNTFAIPLIECTSEQVVRDRVVNPLLELVSVPL